MSKTSRPLKVKKNEDGNESITFVSRKPASIRFIENGSMELSVVLPKSIDGLDSGNLYCAEDGTIMVVD